MSAPQTAQTLREEIAELQVRRESLNHELSGASAELEEARSRLVSGGGKKSIEVVTAAQSRVSALKPAVAALDEQILGKERKLELALESEGRQAAIRQCAEIATSARESLREYEALRAEAAANLAELAARMVAVFIKLIEYRRAFVSLGSGVTPLTYSNFTAPGYGQAAPEEMAAARAFMAELEGLGVDLAAVRMPMDDRLSLIDRDYHLAGVAPFDDVLAMAFRIAATQPARQAQAAGTAAPV
jgi:hypothetical protein